MNCYIFGAGEYFGLPCRPGKGDFCIAADGGLQYLEGEGLKPDLLLGDFDSGLVPPGIACAVQYYPVEKNETDMQLAITAGLLRGADTFLLLGGTGGRSDHTLANIACLAHLAHIGKQGWLIGRDCVYTVVKDRTLTLPGGCPLPLGQGHASVFAFGGDARGVSIRGMQYTATDITLYSHIPTGVSNRYTDGATISVTQGQLLIVLPL